MSHHTTAAILCLTLALASCGDAGDDRTGSAPSPAADTGNSTIPGSDDRARQAPAQQTSGQPAASADTGATASTKPADAPPDRFFGTWVADDVNSPIGDVKVQVTFKQEGPVKILAWSELPFVGQVRDKKAPYEADGDTISSDALRGGTTVKYRFDERGRLVITYADGKSVTFTRK